MEETDFLKKSIKGYKQELKDKLSKVITEIGKKVDKNLFIQVVLQSELFQYCFDQKSDVIQVIHADLKLPCLD